MFGFLRSLDLNPMEWAQAVELTGKGAPYVGEVLDVAFTNAQAVVVLFTPDDLAKLRPELCSTTEADDELNLTPQARPNVIFEAGMAMARNAETQRTRIEAQTSRMSSHSNWYGLAHDRRFGTSNRANHNRE